MLKILDENKMLNDRLFYPYSTFELRIWTWQNTYKIRSRVNQNAEARKSIPSASIRELVGNYEDLS